MNAVVYHGPGDIRLDDVPEPQLRSDTDAVVRITASAVCERDLSCTSGLSAHLEPGRRALAQAGEFIGRQLQREVS